MSATSAAAAAATPAAAAAPASASPAAPATARGSKLKPPGSSVLGSTHAVSPLSKRPGYGSGGKPTSTADPSSLVRKSPLKKPAPVNLSATTGAAGLASGGLTTAAAAGVTTTPAAKKRPSSAVPTRGTTSSPASSTPVTPRVPGASRVIRGSPSTSSISVSASSSRRPSTVSVSSIPAHLRSPSATVSSMSAFSHGSLPGHGHSNSMSLPAQESALAQAQIQIQSLQQQLEHKSAALARAEDEVSTLRLATSASEQQTQMHVLQNKLKNFEQTLQAQRDGVEGALGFAAGAPGRGPGGIHAAREKRFEETIQDLQWQILYGDTSKDLQVARLQDQLILQANQYAHEQLQLAELQAQKAQRREERVEEWLLRDAFTAVI